MPHSITPIPGMMFVMFVPQTDTRHQVRYSRLFQHGKGCQYVPKTIFSEKSGRVPSEYIMIDKSTLPYR